MSKIERMVVSIGLLFISNVAWLWFFNQFDYAMEPKFNKNFKSEMIY